MVNGLMRGPIIAGLAVLAITGAQAAPKQESTTRLNTEAFVAACVKDPVVTDEPGFEADSKATPQVYCECIAGKYQASKLSQADVDMMTKMHKDEITDEDAESYATLEDLMQANEGFEDDCKASLGMPTGTDEDGVPPHDQEEPPLNEEDIPQDE